MLPTQELIDHLADRIERAYALRRAGWYRGCSTRRVWSAAALCLWQAHADDPALPLDSELFVASQKLPHAVGDPWAELAQPEAAHRYRLQVRRIVLLLRNELSREVRIAEGRMDDPLLGLASLLRDRRLSPLGCYIAAHRKGRHDLALRFAGSAAEQHKACPLYREASRTLLGMEFYPAREAPAPTDLDFLPRSHSKSIVMN